MKLKYYIFMLYFLILSGCTLNYNLIIDENLIISEYIKVEEDNEVISTYSNSVEGFIDYNLFEYERNEDSDYYFFEKFNKGNISGVVANYTYLDFNEFKEKNKLIKDFFIDMNMSSNENIIKLYFEANPYNEMLEDKELSSSILKKTNIKISLPFKVINTNADKIQDNEYIWELERNNYGKDIIIEFDKSKKKIKIPPTSYLLGILIIIILFFIFTIYKKYKKNSEF